MSVVHPIEYPANKLDRLIADEIIFSPLFDWDFARKRNLVANGRPPITFTRGSSGTYFDAYGVLQTASTNVARFDHDPVTGSSLGLLIEAQRENEILWNRDLTQDGGSPWTLSNTTAAKDVTGIDNAANSASTLTATAANGTVLQTVTKASAANTYSVWLKRKTGSGDIDITDNNGTNWTTVAVTSSWLRFDITRTQANPIFGIRIVTDTDAVYVDMNQLEAGSFRTSEIATTTAAVTRSADVATTALSGVPGFSVTEGTVFIEYALIIGGDAGTFPGSWSIDDGTGDDSIDLALRQSDNLTFCRVKTGTVAQALVELTAPSSPTTMSKVAMVWATNDVSGAQDGTLAGTPDTSATIPTGLTTLRIGKSSRAGENADVHIARFVYWNQRLPDGILQTVTS